MNVATSILSAADRAELERVLARGVVYIDHTDLHRPDAEHHLFTAAAIPAPDSTWLNRYAHTGKFQGHAIQVLTRQQEAALFARFNYCRLRVAQLRAAAQGDDAAGGELLGWHRRAVELRGVIVEHFLPLTVTTLRKAPRPIRRRLMARCAFDELVSEAVIGLMRAVDQNDWTRGRFATTAIQNILWRYRTLNRDMWRQRRKAAGNACAAEDAQGLIDDGAVAVWRKQSRDDDAAALIDRLRIVLRDNLAGLSHAERVAVELRFGADRNPVARACSALGVAAAGVKRLVSGALIKLRMAIEWAGFRQRVSVDDAQRLQDREAERRRINGRATSKPRGAWGEWVYQRAMAAGFDTLGGIAKALGTTHQRLAIVLHRGTKSTRLIDGLCGILRVNRDTLLSGWRDTCAG